MPDEHVWYRIPPAPGPAAAAGQNGTIDLGTLGRMGVMPLWTRFTRWRLARLERHYQICADIEAQHAREAHLNAAWYQKQAALTRRRLALEAA